ncbi:hypothetical protein [Actinacidiphila oryziradicis]|nr:hypothetical protein [Actinacidiphila oryziradicis]
MRYWIAHYQRGLTLRALHRAAYGSGYHMGTLAVGVILVWLRHRH